MPDLILTVASGIATLTINRPDHRNAMNSALCDELLVALTDIAEDDSVKALVLTGAGRQAFCAGGDINRMDHIAAQDFNQRVANLRRWGGITLLLHTMPKITIAMVNGVAAGAGLSLAAACDFRLAARSARFTTAYVKVARSGDFGGTALLTRLLGAARARELYLLGTLINSEQAEAFGLVTKIFDDDKLAAETLAFATERAAGPQIAYGYIKQNLLAAETMPLADLIDLEAVNHAKTGSTAEHLAAVAAFRARRQGS
jgi:2-(1,2-epoxy-1,2-dihydrophenyl)acetyl-CoA isomerase